eukprot:comp22521_c1_seq4/m.34158 comp22521_c1_seq4/g.34158  ORF comp22521_c1_seq4/g.34158 comp22521_c1_seq4/m.34158 type:complete len:529 (-) comp22521_c1_seq4:80-1666(-)
MYDALEEYGRMGVPNDQWRISTANSSYKLCETYPRILFVPAKASDALLQKCASFRSKHRLPVLSYYHAKTKASIARCSQPQVGLKSRRCEEDERMVQLIFGPSTGREHCIVDARPYVNAMANRASGAGYENPEWYVCSYRFMGIDNIHVMRSALARLLDGCHAVDGSSSNWLGAMQASAWLHHVGLVLSAAVLVARAVACDGASMLVHCSDGWDRTAQLTALAQVCLDPVCRTIDGFVRLVCKEWLSYGHKFVARCGMLGHDKKEASPIFAQFLDCTWQMLVQCPTAFEFGPQLLATIHDELYLCRYGTFLGNSQKYRERHGLARKTASLWDHIEANRDTFTNPTYSSYDGLLLPDTAPQRLRVWTDLYCQYEPDVQPQEDSSSAVGELWQEVLWLQAAVSRMEAKVAALAQAQDTAHTEWLTALHTVAQDQPSCRDEVDCLLAAHEAPEQPAMHAGSSNSVPAWPAMESAGACESCRVLFGPQGPKKHVCWVCCRVLCADCSRWRLLAPDLHYQSHVRACKACAARP